MGLFVLLGVFLLYRALRRESRLRLEQHRFLTGATHRLKTPLATIRLGVESIQAGSMPEEKRERYLQAMLREADRLEQDLTNLLTAGGLESTGTGLRPTRGDIAVDARRAADAMTDRFSTAHVGLDVQIRGPLDVVRDPAAVGLILHNLLDNAVRHSPPQTTVRLRAEPRAGYAEIVVEDEGIGIDPADLPRVFERFYSGRGSEVKGGSGLGLFLVRELVQAHEGSVDIRNRTDRAGTVVTVLLPLAEVLA